MLGEWVDFHYEINGKMYDFSIPGGGFVSLEHVVEVLGIAEADENTENGAENAENGAENGNDFVGEVPGVDVSDENDTAYEEAIKLNEVEVSEATKKFVADVESVEFSSPELVWVGKADEAATVGELKEANGLDVEYSADLTEEQIAEINAQTVEAGDWALISVQPFTSEESLAVTMKNGDVWTVKVTDASVELGSILYNEIMDGKLFYLYMRYAGDTIHHLYGDERTSNNRGDYYLKYDGATSNALEYSSRDSEEILANQLGNDYLWQFSWDENTSSWIIRNVGHPDYYISPSYSWSPVTSNDASSRVDLYSVLQNGQGAIPIDGSGYAGDYTYAQWEEWYTFLGFSLENAYTGYELSFNNTTHSFTGSSNGSVRIRAVSVENPQAVVSYTQDDINHGQVASSHGESTVESKLTISNDTTSTGLSRYIVTAQPKEGYRFNGWEVVSGHVTNWGTTSSITAASATIQPTVTQDTILKATFAQNPLITATQDDIEHGSVKYNNGTADVVTAPGQLTLTVGTRGPLAVDNIEEYQALYNITAEPEDGYRFVRWEVSGDGEVAYWGTNSTFTETSAQIRPYIKNGEVTLKAVFEKIPEQQSDLDPNSAAGLLVKELREEMARSNADVKKTAHVLDEEKRTYQINLSASSERKVIGPKMTLSFITDISRSMYFPANLKEVKGGIPVTDTTAMRDWLKQTGNITVINSDGTEGTISRPNVYYMILDINNTATMVAVYNDNGTWKTIDASYYYKGDNWNRANNVEISNGALKENNSTTNKGINDLISSGVAHLYTVYSTSETDPDTNVTTTFFTRLDYLKKSVGIIVDVVYEVDPDAEIGLVTFARGTLHIKDVSSDTGNYTTAKYNKNQKEDLKDAIDDIVEAGGTRQDHGLQETVDYLNCYNVNAGHPQVAILVTDGAPQQAGDNPWTNVIAPQAKRLKDLGVELYTMGLSLDKVGTNKASLYGISGYKNNDGEYVTADKYKHNAESGEEAVNELMDILRSMEEIGNLLGTVTDTVDEAFYPIDPQTGLPVQEGVYDKDGNRLGDVSTYLNDQGKPRHYVGASANPLYSEKDETPYYTWTVKDGKWVITWYNQLITKVKDSGEAGWTKSFPVKAKEDFLGGNAVNTNAGLATLSADRFKQQGYPDYIGTFDTPVTGTAETPRVNVAELGFDKRSTEWTVYLDTSVNPRQQLETFYDQIMVHERVTKEDAQHRIASDGQSCLPDADNAKTYQFKPLPNLTDAEWDSVLAGHPAEKDYSAYGHRDMGTIRVELINDGQSTNGTLNSEHPASPVGMNSECYTLKVTYTPEPADATTVWRTTEGEGKSPGREAVPMVSENKHIINVYVLPLRIQKNNESGDAVRGATFAIYREAKPGEEGEALSGYTGLPEEVTSYYCIDTQTTDSDGVAVLAQPSDGQGSQNAIVPGETYYLVETQQPNGYKRNTTAYKVTVEVTDGIYTNLGEEIISEKAYPFNWDQGATIKINDKIATIVNRSGTEEILYTDDTEETRRYYVVYSDNCTFMTEILNVSATDIRIYKVDADGETGLPGAVFQLLTVKNGAEVIVTHEDAGGILETVEITENGNTLTFTNAFSTNGSEHIITERPNGNYILREIHAPAGYVNTIGDIEFKIENRVMSMITDVSNNDKLDFQRATQTSTPTLALLTITNEPGAALPATGGPGTTFIYILGTMLTCLAGTIPALRRKRRAA